MSIEGKVKFKPFRTPNFALVEMKVGARNQGWAEGPKYPVSEIDASALASLCDQFRADIFSKAGKLDPAI